MHRTTRSVCWVRLFALCAAVAACGGNDDPAPAPSPAPGPAPGPAPAPNAAPVATISSPAAGSTFRAGDTLTFAGSGTDAEDGALAAGRLTWWADLHHNTHTHPFVQPTTGGSRQRDDSGARRDLGQHLLPLSPARDRQRGGDARGHARRAAAQGRRSRSPRSPTGPATDARRPADHGAAHLHRRGRHRARSRRCQPGSQLPQLPVQQLEPDGGGRHADDRHAGGQHHLHRDLHRHRAGRQRADREPDGAGQRQHRHARRTDHAERNGRRQRRQHRQRRSSSTAPRRSALPIPRRPTR